MPSVGGRDPQRAARGALSVRVGDVVVGLVVLDRALRACRTATGSARRTGGCPCARRPCRARRRRSTSAITLPMPPAPGDAVRAEPGGHEEARDLGLAEAELVVRGERLRAVDQLRIAGVGHHRHPDAAEFSVISSNRSQSSGSSLPLKSAGIGVVAAARAATRRRGRARSRPSAARRPPRGSTRDCRGHAGWAAFYDPGPAAGWAARWAG